MESALNAIILGIIQGLTEFLPISSSGHLELARFFLGTQDSAADNLFMTITLHAATALSTIFIFRQDVSEIIKAVFSGQWNEETKLGLKIVISMVPAAIVGLLFEEQISVLFDKQIPLVSLMLILTGLLLFFADKAKSTDKPVGYGHALMIGIAQAIAILPGISRSGATISSAVLLGIDRERAARFSFLMVVPLILGKMLLDIMDGGLATTAIKATPLLAGFFAAFVSGSLACLWMIRLVKRSKLTAFSLYCFAIAALALYAYYN